jgi:hypothetical protein
MEQEQESFRCSPRNHQMCHTCVVVHDMQRRRALEEPCTGSTVIPHVASGRLVSTLKQKMTTVLEGNH